MGLLWSLICKYYVVSTKSLKFNPSVHEKEVIVVFMVDVEYKFVTGKKIFRLHQYYSIDYYFVDFMLLAIKKERKNAQFGFFY